MREAFKFTLAGWISVIAGVIVAGGSFFMPTSIPIDQSAELTAELNAFAAGLPAPSSAEGVINIGLLQQQMMVLHVGLSIIISGPIFLAVGAILDRMTRRVPVPSVTSSPAASVRPYWAKPAAEEQVPAGEAVNASE